MSRRRRAILKGTRLDPRVGETMEENIRARPRPRPLPEDQRSTERDEEPDVERKPSSAWPRDSDGVLKSYRPPTWAADNGRRL